MTGLRKPIEPAEPPIPPFWGSRVVTDIALPEIIPFINRLALFRGQWGVKGSKLSRQEYERRVQEQLEPTLQLLSLRPKER